MTTLQNVADTRRKLIRMLIEGGMTLDRAEKRALELERVGVLQASATN